MAANETSVGPTVSWSLVISLGLFFFAVIGGSWTVVQSQFNNLIESIKIAKTDADKSIILLQSQLDRRFSEVDKIGADRAGARVTSAEFNQFSANVNGQIDIIRNQIKVLEQTKPSTGELQAAYKNSDGVSTRLEDRVRALEQYLLGQSKVFGQTK